MGLDAGSSVALIEAVVRDLKLRRGAYPRSVFIDVVDVCLDRQRRGIPYNRAPLGTLSPYTFANRKRWLKLLYFPLY